MASLNKAIIIGRLGRDPVKIRPQQKRKGKMNGWEARLARELELDRKDGCIHAWAYEAIRFQLAPGSTYTPDFMAVYNDEIVFIEVKGQRRAAGMAKFRIAAEMYPWFKWRMVTLKQGRWETVLEV